MDVDVRIARAVRYLEAHAGRAFPLEETAAGACGTLFHFPASLYLRSMLKGDPADIPGIWLHLCGHWLARHGVEPGMALDYDGIRNADPHRVELFLSLKERKA